KGFWALIWGLFWDHPSSPFTLAYHYAVRVLELRRLKWRDVDLKKRIVMLPGEITKTGKPRTVPLPLDFDRKQGKPEDLVFPLGDFRDQWRAACIRIDRKSV